MKKEKVKFVHFCDGCDKEEGFMYSCDVCGDEYCYECVQKGLLITYQHGINFSGSGDGHFCTKCEANPPARFIPLLAAYRTIGRLRDESRAYYEDFKKRQDEAEKSVMTNRNKLGLK